ncbi:hypothetical protein [Phytoactinopolyspora halotolerans]|uniref:Uncharacterized protein n=1 Tax=Phytoactinopolyspora halotolerans TaxID=1981512 RepID=A0A6L9SI93_9ACTN|nr:hypothetical protein [Phytoactinopolyspora halotolerans]NEE04152.1 hypothetical protein [Phytoactinopolyspora halotolerans]
MDDLATLFGLALESAPPATLIHGVTEPAVSTVMLAAAADVVANGNGTAERWAHDEAIGTLGEQFTEALSLRQAVSGDRARDLLRWRPRSHSAVQDILDGCTPESVGSGA